MLEFDLIAYIRNRVRAATGVALGIGDDAAVLDAVAGEQWVVCTDTLVAGVHFPHETGAADIGYKTLAVNLSDLAAMGARPRFATLALTLPGVDVRFVEDLIEALIALGETHALTLVGGDTTRGPLSLTLTAIGVVPQGRALRRDTARVGDGVYVSGTLGDAAAALSLRAQATMLDGEARRDFDVLYQRLARPTPRVALGLALRDCARACIDVSDGLSADLAHICAASGVAAAIDPALLPASAELTRLLPDSAARLQHQLSGDDYELCFSVDPERESELAAIAATCAVRISRIGCMIAGSGVHLRAHDGHLRLSTHQGYQHFA